MYKQRNSIKNDGCATFYRRTLFSMVRVNPSHIAPLSLTTFLPPARPAPRLNAPLGPCSRNVPRALWRPLGGGLFLMSEVPLQAAPTPFFYFTLVTGPQWSSSLKLSDTRVYEPQIRAPYQAGIRLLSNVGSKFASRKFRGNPN